MLSACNGGVRKTLGISNTVPNEFNVLSQKKLAIPEQFILAKPQTASKMFENESITGEVAKKILFKDDTILNDKVLTESELSLLNKFGNSDNNVRLKLDEEYRNQQKNIASVTFIKEILEKYRQGDKSTMLLDAEAESQRLAELRR
jgi:hypothetical protein